MVHVKKFMFFDTKKGFLVSHLAYSDDLIIFSKGSHMAIKKILEFLKHYEKISGQKINFEKSDIFLGKSGDVQLVQSQSGFSVKSLPFYYLGAPISKGNKKVFLYDPLIAKVKKKLMGWNLNLISQGGRWVILKSVLSSMPVYLLQVLNPPISVLNVIDKLISRFF